MLLKLHSIHFYNGLDIISKGICCSAPLKPFSRYGPRPKTRRYVPTIARREESLHSCPAQNLSSSACSMKKAKFENPFEEDLKKRKEFTSPLVLVLDTNESITSMSLDSALKLAKRRDLKLVKIEDPSKITRSTKDIYQLLGTKEYNEMYKQRQAEIKQQKEVIKGEKTMLLKSSIEPNDLKIKMRLIRKWVESRYFTRIQIIQSSTQGKVDIVKTVEDEVRELGGKVFNLTSSDQMISFTIRPPAPLNKAAGHRKEPGESAAVPRSKDGESDGVKGDD